MRVLGQSSYAMLHAHVCSQTSKSAVRTRGLTNSFGWDAGQTYQQHDVHEMNRVLSDHLSVHIVVVCAAS